ncbi:hypothetical protein LTR78_000811 [Recurvomyces mirabilis]|uniref:Major facilitator superfamily (MFS) profile domain-containing protein n=1 Tax=Recurvomyces mirabilis TaxID=574656 RepID=A0AAE0WVX7_9PEZI|nr:hypothetical protein LTR78_000811 [Recurvomyces mirabilis]KAK5158780.1 hypothetical protein LTS14_002888 [Recurvomyces mirabilis]
MEKATEQRHSNGKGHEVDAEQGANYGIGHAEAPMMQHREDDDRADEAKGRNADQMDRKYWLSVNYIGTMFAIGMAFMGGIGGFGLVAPILGTIDVDLGPSPNINWVPLVNICGGAVFFLMVGKLSDIFGRRWFFILGSVLGLLGSITGAVAMNVNTIIGAEVLIGVAVAFQQSFFWAVAELVPMKYRYFANSYCYLMTIPSSPLSARVAYSFLQYPGTWRNSFYFLIAINVVSILSWWAFYHPPTFSMLHRKKLARDLLLHFDWIGVLLYSAGLIIFIFGLNWGGVLYPWESPQVLATTVIGGITLFVALPIWELFVKKRGKEPYLPLHLFKNVRYMAAAWNNGLGAEYDVGTLAGLTAMAFVFAQVCHGFVEWITGPKWGTRGAALCGCALMTACATDLGNRPLTIGLLIPGAFCMGLVEGISTTTSTFHLRSQEEIGEGGGLCGSIRNFTSAIAVAIYTATLSNRLDKTIPQYVAPVALRMGLPQGSLQSLYAAVQGKASYDLVNGLTPAIKEAVQYPWQEAFIKAGGTVFLVSAAFSGTALILSLFFTNNDKNTLDFVASNVHGKAMERQYATEHKEFRRSSLTGAES